MTRLVCLINKEQEAGVVNLEEGKPEDRVESALRCLPHYDPASSWNSKSTSFRYWKIRDYAYAYRSGLTTPEMVSRSPQTKLSSFPTLV